MNSRFWILTALIVTVALCRYFLISIPNAAPIAAIALFGGAYFADRKYALIVPLLALLLSDIMMEITFQLGMQPFPGFYSTMMLVVYTTIALIVGVGLLLKNRRKPLFIGLSAIFAGLLFFLVTNFAVWAFGGGSFYPLNLGGLMTCYAAGIPFLKNTLISNLLFTGFLFGSFELIMMRFPRLATIRS